MRVSFRVSSCVWIKRTPISMHCCPCLPFYRNNYYYCLHGFTLPCRLPRGETTTHDPEAIVVKGDDPLFFFFVCASAKHVFRRKSDTAQKLRNGGGDDCAHLRIPRTCTPSVVVCAIAAAAMVENLTGEGMHGMGVTREWRRGRCLILLISFFFCWHFTLQFKSS